MSKSAGKASGGSAAGAAAGTQSPQSAALGAGAVSPSNPAPPTPGGVVAAFQAAPGFQDNNVRMDILRDRLGGTRAEQDAAIRQAWADGRISLDTYENLGRAVGTRTRKEIDAQFYVAPASAHSPDALHKGPDGRWYREALGLVSKGRNWRD